MTLYNAKSTSSPHEIIVTKFDDDFVPEDNSTYNVTRSTCTCPAGLRPTCRHRKMWPILMTLKDLGQFWDYDKEQVVKGPESQDAEA